MVTQGTERLQTVSSTLSRIVKWQYLGLCFLVLVNLGLHFSIIAQPNGLVFDENHYIVEARGIMAGWGPFYTEHPPLAKLFIISSISLFGDGPLGWRFFSVLFGVAGIVLFYFICRSLKMSYAAQLIATSLFSLENLSFTQASIAMLDVYSVTFMLAAFLLYLRRKHFSSGFCLGLSALAKLTGALAFLPIFLHWLFDGARRVRFLLVLALSALAFFLLIMPLLNFTISHTLSSPFELIREALNRGSAFTFNASYNEFASRPWEWLLGPQAIFYSYNPQYVAMVTPTIWVFIIPSVLYMLVRAIRGNSASLFGLSWFAATYLPWIPISLITDRMTFLYYLYPAIGAICIGLGLGLAQLIELWKTQARRLAIGMTASYLVLHVILFVVLSPVFLPLVRWLPMS
jgi:dolichyl-phosphate-mannose-protein mannosyltransferase